MTQKHIPELIGQHTSHVELILSGTPEALEAAKQELTIVNKSLQMEAMKLRKTPPRNQEHLEAIKERLREIEPKITITYFEEIGGGRLSVPAGYYFLCEKMLDNGHINKVKPMITYEGEKYPARYYQVKAVEELMKYTRSTFLGATGCGKSKVISMLTNSYVNVEARVLIVTPSVYLMRQLFDSTRASLKEAIQRKTIISMNGDGEFMREGSDVVVTTTQSALAIADRFDVVIFDELHTLAAETYLQVAIAAINATAVHGLTGSLKRMDGMERTIPAWVGKTVYSYLYKDGVRDGYLNKVQYIQIPVDNRVTERSNLPLMTEYKRQYKNKIMIERVHSIINKAKAAGRSIITLGKSIETLKAMAEPFDVDVADADYKYPIIQYIKKEKPMLFATSKLVGTGVDFQEADCMIYLDNGSSNITLIQSAGRLTRKIEGKKTALFIDIYPDNERGREQAEKRLSVAIDQGWEMGDTK